MDPVLMWFLLFVGLIIGPSVVVLIWRRRDSRRRHGRRRRRS